MNTLDNPSSPLLSDLADTELMTEIIQGSQRALEILHARHSPVLRSVIHQVLNNHAEVDEVLQDLFVFLWSRGNTYSSEKGQVLGWLVTIARRRALDRVRMRSAYQHATERFEASSRQPTQNVPSAWIVDQEVRQHELQTIVGESLQLLPPHQREAVTLAFLKGMSQREIAAQLSIPLGTVKTRVELGVRKLSLCSLLQNAA